MYSGGVYWPEHSREFYGSESQSRSGFRNHGEYSGNCAAVVGGSVYCDSGSDIFREDEADDSFGVVGDGRRSVSNLGERILWGYVVDWIPVPFLDLQYNLADVEISLGALIVFLMMIYSDMPKNNRGVPKNSP